MRDEPDRADDAAEAADVAEATLEAEGVRECPRDGGIGRIWDDAGGEFGESRVVEGCGDGGTLLAGEASW